jgi:uncharacterized protein YqjF (DUF2071 family)
MTDRGSTAVAETRSPDWERIARQYAHRPWPPPERPWLIRQTWRDLLFAHWPIAPASLRPHIPAALQLDTFAGDAWIGVVPFHLSPIAPRGAPASIGLAFPELNVRTYVRLEDKPGIWFFSLDAASLLAVIGARATFHLPYFWAAMQIRHEDEAVVFYSQRRRRGLAAARFVGRYQPTGPIFTSAPGSLERWLTARYCLYAADHAGRIYRGEINHDPWPLHAAAADLSVNTTATSLGIDLARPPLLHFARRLDMVTWWPQLVA